jgi:hypothetical protein
MAHRGMKRSAVAIQHMREAQKRRYDGLVPIPANMANIRVPQSRQSSQEARIKKLLRSRYKNLVRRVLKKTSRRKEIPSEQYLGYSQQRLRRHLESQFTNGMGWERRDSFEIDHIIPVSRLMEIGITEPRIVNALANLRPVAMGENRAKSDSCDMDAFCRVLPQMGDAALFDLLFI